MSESWKRTTATVIVSDGHELRPEYHLPKASIPQSQSSKEDVQEELVSRHNLHRKTLQLEVMKVDRNKQDVANVDSNGYSSNYMSLPPKTPKGRTDLDMDFFYYYIVNERTIVGRYNDIESALRHLSLFGNNSRNRFTRRALIPVFSEAPSHPYSLLSKGFISQFLHKKNNASSRVKQTITNAEKVRNSILKSLSCCYWETEKELGMMTRVVEKEHKILFPSIYSTSSMRFNNQQRRLELEGTVKDRRSEPTVNDVIIDLPPSNRSKKERFAGQRFRDALRRKTLQVYQEATVFCRAKSGRGNLHIISDNEDK